MLTINRPFYEYRDIYLFIAVGLAAFITTFVVLGVVTSINTSQLNNSTQESRLSVPVANSKPTDKAATKSSESKASSNDKTAAVLGGNNTGTLTQPTGATQNTAPTLQSPAIATPPVAAPSSNSGINQPQQPTVIVQQPLPSAPATSNPQQPADDSSVIDLQLPLGIGLKLL